MDQELVYDLLCKYFAAGENTARESGIFYACCKYCGICKLGNFQSAKFSTITKQLIARSHVVHGLIPCPGC